MKLFKRTTAGIPATEGTVTTFETAKGTRLPEDYRQHMLDLNGGVQISDGNLYFANYVSDEGELVLSSLFHFEGPGSSVVEASELYDSLPNGIVIGDFDGGLISMSLDEGDYGHIYMEFSYTDPEKIANSFTEFLNGLEPYD